LQPSQSPYFTLATIATALLYPGNRRNRLTLPSQQIYAIIATFLANHRNNPLSDNSKVLQIDIQ
jgi:hypothetical protein